MKSSPPMILLISLIWEMWTTESGTGKEVETWKNAPLITLRGKKLKDHNFIDDTGA